MLESGMPPSELAVMRQQDETGMSSWTRFDLITTSADFTLEVLANKLERKEMVPPKFQRLYVWKQPKASGLIESFLRGLPVPPIYLYQRGSEVLIIDGLQRLLTIYYYLRGVFPPLTRRADSDMIPQKTQERRQEGFRPFKLFLGEHNPYHGKSFDELTAEDQTTLSNSSLKSYLLRQISPSNDSSIYYVFQRLNTGGVTLSEQEIRSALYYGKFKEHLELANRLPAWRSILGSDKVDLRGRDVELLLRVLAVAFDADGYQSKPFGGFLSAFMAANRDSRKIGRYFRSFERACEAIVQHHGGKPFHAKGRTLNPSVLDAIFGAYIRNETSVQSKARGLRSRLTALNQDDDFLKSISDATTDPNVVRLRLSRAEHILFG